MLLYSQEVGEDCTSNEEDLFILWVLPVWFLSVWVSEPNCLIRWVYRFIYSWFPFNAVFFFRFFMELNNRIFQILSEVAGSADPTLTADHVRAMGLDPQGDRSFLLDLLDVYGIDVGLVVDNLCCSWAHRTPPGHVDAGGLFVPVRPTNVRKTLPPPWNFSTVCPRCASPSTRGDGSLWLTWTPNPEVPVPAADPHPGVRHNDSCRVWMSLCLWFWRRRLHGQDDRTWLFLWRPAVPDALAESCLRRFNHWE